MLQWLGQSPPEKKTKVEGSSRQEYEKKRERSFQPSWQKHFTWVRKMKLRDATWPALQTSFGEAYPSFFIFINYLLSLPGSSVDAERGFSRMKIIKSDWRSRLGESNLSDQVMVNLETEAVGEFDPMPAIVHWFSGGQRARRPFYKDEMRKCQVPMESQALFRTGEVVPERSGDPEDSEDRAVVEDDIEEEQIEVMELQALTPDFGHSDSEEEEELNRKDLIAMQQKSYRLLLENMKNYN